MSIDILDDFIAHVDSLVDRVDDQHTITNLIAARLSALLDSGYRLPAELTRPSPEHQLTYPLHIAADGSWSLVLVVWNRGQRTPVHSHETWGVAGIYEGVEREHRYLKPRPGESVTALTPLGVQEWKRGQVTVCCTTDDDVHSVEAVGEEATIGLHVYGADLGVLNRRSYDPETGAVTWFVSGWDRLPAVAEG